MQRKIISQFNGLNKFIDPKKVSFFYCSELKNADILTGSVIPIKKHKYYKTIKTRRFLFSNDNLIERDFEFYTYYNGKLFTASSNDYPRDDAGVQLGFYAKDKISYDMYDTELPVPLMDYSITEVLTGGNLPSNTKFYYAIAYYDETNKRISTLKEKTKKTTLGSATKKFNISNIDDYGGYKKIVLRKWTDDTWRVLTILDNGTTSYTDSVYDISSKQKVDYYYYPMIFRYGYTYYSSKLGLETPMADLTPEISIKSFAKLKLTIPVSHKNYLYDKVRIYELGGNYSDFILIAELDADFNNGYVIYNITNFNSSALGAYNAQKNLPAPFGLKYITEYNYILFGAVGDTLYFSEFAQPYYWGDGTNWIKFPNIITGICKTSAGLLVFTSYETYLLVGTSIENMIVRLLSKTTGCKNYESVVNIEGNAIWVDNDYGIMISNGFKLDYLSFPILGNYINSLDIYQAVLHEKRIYFLHTKGVLVYDFTIPNKAFFFEIDDIWDFALSYKNELYISKFNGVDYDVYIAFKGDGVFPIHYKTSQITDGIFTHDKEWHSIAVSFKGSGICNIYVDGELSISEPINSVRPYYQEIKIPSATNKGMFIEIEVKGELELYSIEFTYNIRGNYV